MLVTNPRNQKLSVQVKDSLGFIHLTVGAGEVTPLWVLKILNSLFFCSNTKLPIILGVLTPSHFFF